MDIKQVPHVVIENKDKKEIKEVKQVKEKKDGSKARHFKG